MDKAQATSGTESHPPVGVSNSLPSSLLNDTVQNNIVLTLFEMFDLFSFLNYVCDTCLQNCPLCVVVVVIVHEVVIIVFVKCH